MRIIKYKLVTLLYIMIPALCWSQTITAVEQLEDKVIATLEEGKLSLTPLSNSTIRVQFMAGEQPDLPELVLTEAVEKPAFKLSETDQSLEIKLKALTVTLDKQTGVLTYTDAAGKVILKEKPNSRILKKSSIQNEPCYIVEQTFESPEDEYLYGTGQFQDGYLNVKGLPRRLTQVNTQISVPFIMSSKGYGLLWHNYGLTDYNPADQQVTQSSMAAEGAVETLDITTTEGTKKEVRQEGVFRGTLKVEKSGEYGLLLDVGRTMARKWNVSIDGKEIINLKNHWLPPTTSAITYLEAGTHEVVVNGEKNDRPVLHYREVNDETTFRSPVAQILDYVVFSGSPDEVIAAYRHLTGQAPMMPIWSLGYIHCRERFHSQEELLENAKEFRKRKLPLDMIVQDWQYWGKYGWNAMKFDEDHYPDPASMVNELHDMDMRLMLSVWSRIDRKSALGKDFESKNFYIPETHWVDFFNEEAAAYYWKNFSSRLLKPYQIDGWWQDATEPENDDLLGRRVNNGTMAGEHVRNVYPLYVTKTVYEGLRKDAPDKRAFILTRSGFSGMQKYASAVWTGDVGHDWETLRRQLTAGLSYTVTGMPYWTFDGGGFFRPGRGQYQDKAYHERFLRWLQLSTFSPLMRVHGYQTNTEFWRYGEEVEKVALKYLNLRYSLLPYIYAEAARITFDEGTLMRPLVMDFANDTEALEQKHEYMFGAAFLVAPVLQPDVDSWKVYLPENAGGWYDFWSGTHAKGGQSINKQVSVSTIPLFVKAGSIVPFGKPVQHSNELPSDTLEIRVYTGADASFELYEDDGTSYDYEQGAFTKIPMQWDESKQKLTIGEREGQYEGYLKNRIFKVVWINQENSTKELEVAYAGKKIKVKKP